MEDLPDEFNTAFCIGINADTWHDDALNELAWSILDYALDRHE